GRSRRVEAVLGRDTDPGVRRFLGLHLRRDDEAVPTDRAPPSPTTVADGAFGAALRALHASSSRFRQVRFTRLQVFHRRVLVRALDQRLQDRISLELDGVRGYLRARRNWRALGLLMLLEQRQRSPG